MNNQESVFKKLENVVGFYESKLQNDNVDKEDHDCIEKMNDIIKDFDKIKHK